MSLNVVIVGVFSDRGGLARWLFGGGNRGQVEASIAIGLEHVQSTEMGVAFLNCNSRRNDVSVD
jgi:hypothetical protein